MFTRLLLSVIGFASVILSTQNDGDIYVWGGGSEGQLGLGEETECPKPTLLDTADRVICISCGYYHTAFVTDQGEVFTFGESDGGKLGLGDESVKAQEPIKVDLPEKAKEVACGGSHTVVLAKSGKVYTFGDGSNGQLGHGNKILQSASPVPLHLSQKVAHVACGENHTALVTDKGQLFTFGDGRHGKLALGQDSFSNQLFPVKVDRFTRFLVEKVSCGGCHMIVTAHMKMQNGHIESSEEEEEENEALTQSLRPDGSMDLGGSVGARNRRRQESMKRTPSLNRTLPALTHNAKDLESLSATHPPTDHKSQKSKSPAVPARKIPPVKSKRGNIYWSL
ncbi:hypothetical protein FSP39_012686 [Pinctada imbricata]|uniref:RCC1-like domain-containing protein n=1 Tax=Pinctada imbricata TaxID=66713 RepID=A0AA89BHG6_PINIB|nr:hypothetical protein FSP39_012686 [Pinctada imbricata]